MPKIPQGVKPIATELTSDRMKKSTGKMTNCCVISWDFMNLSAMVDKDSRVLGVEKQLGTIFVLWHWTLEIPASCQFFCTKPKDSGQLRELEVGMGDDGTGGRGRGVVIVEHHVAGGQSVIY